MKTIGDQTQFKLTLHGISLELVGERGFVEEMYRTIMSDIEVARSRAREVFTPADRTGEHAQVGSVASQEGLDDQPTEVFDKHRYSSEKVIWLHRCTSLVHKIYMATPRDLRAMPVFNALNLSRMSTLYMEEELVTRMMPKFEKGQTLWAELTRAGREKIASAKFIDPSDANTVHTPRAQFEGVQGTSKTNDQEKED